MLGGLEWAGLPIVAELLGIEDVETLVRQLIAIREDSNKRASAS